MQVRDIKTEGLTHHFKITIPAKDIQEKIDQKLQDLTRTLKIDGFRPGKVPLSVIQKRYGDAVQAEIIDKCLRDSLPEAIKQKNIRPATAPKVDLGDIEPGKDLEVNITLEVMPEIKPMDLESIELTSHRIKVPPSSIEESLETLRQRSSTSKPIEKKRGTKEGDVIIIDFVGRQGGKTFEGGSAQDFSLELGAKTMIEGFEGQIIGMKPGDQKTIKVTFPADYHQHSLAGQEAEFDITLKEIREKIPAEINDELAEKMGKKTVDELRQDIETMIQENYDEQARQYTKRCLFDILHEGHDFPVPQEMLEQEFHAIWHQFEHEREHGHIDDDDKHKSDEELKANYRQIAERRVRLGLLLAEIGRLNNIEVENSDIRSYLERESKKRPYYVNEMLKLLRKDPAVVDDLKGQLFEEKVVDFILQKIKLLEKPISFEEFQNIIAQKEISEPKKKTTKSTQKVAQKKAEKSKPTTTKTTKKKN